MSHVSTTSAGQNFFLMDSKGSFGMDRSVGIKVITRSRGFLLKYKAAEQLAIG